MAGLRPYVILRVSAVLIIGLARRKAAPTDDLSPENIDRLSGRDDAFPQRMAMKGYIMPVGTVKFFNSQKGFGFIQPEDGSKDIFVHISAVERANLGTLSEGQRVQFEAVTDRRTGKVSADSLEKAA